MFLELSFAIIVLLTYATWRFGTRNFGYWKQKGVKHEKPVFFVGNMFNQLTHRVSLTEQISMWCEKFPEEKYVGVHMANDLGLVLRDPELIKRVLITDFQYFHHRGFHSHKHVREPIFQNLFTADGDVWKLMRQCLTPAFSSKKIRDMFPLIERMTEKMILLTKPGYHDVRELMARYTTDVIGACGFGLDFDSLSDETSMFRRLGKRIVTFTTRDALVHMAKRMAPEFFKHLNYFPAEVTDDTNHLVKEILNKRNYVPTERHDFIDLLLEVKQKGKVIGKSMELLDSEGMPKTIDLELDDQLIAAQVFVFFGAGFDTSSSATSFLLHELALEPDVQERCHIEVDKVLSRHGGKVSYEAVKEMEYLTMAFKEVLRLHPSPGYLIRKCVKEYTFPETNLTIDADVSILIPLHLLHKDPKFFEDPESFRPDRFKPDQVDNISKHTFMPFGEGPRACIGERLGLFQSIAGVAALLSRFRVEPAPTTCRRPLIDPNSFFVDSIIGGLPLTLIARDSTN